MMTEREPFNRVRVTVLDSVACGFAYSRLDEYKRDLDIYKRSDQANSSFPTTPVNSLLHASQARPLHVPALESMGLKHIPGLERLMLKSSGVIYERGAYGVLTPTFAGNGSPEGHQALMGHIVKKPYQLFDETGFPTEVVDLVRDTVAQVLKREKIISPDREIEIIRYLGTDDVNGVVFINTPGIGDAHVKSKDDPGPLKIPIYASADSLIQIALHQGVIPQKQIKMIGEAVREAVNHQKGLRIARIIMRPFEDDPLHKDGPFKRVSKDRIDFGVDPDEPTLIDYLQEAGIDIYGVGKAASMLNYRGFDHAKVFKLGTDEERMQAIVSATLHHEYKRPSFYFDNLIGEDELFGHTRKPLEWSRHLDMIDFYIAHALEQMGEDDLWIITADHGNDPTQQNHRNHTNERVPLLVYSPRMKGRIDLGVRHSFADVAKTAAENFGIADKLINGTSFLKELV